MWLEATGVASDVAVPETGVRRCWLSCLTRLSARHLEGYSPARRCVGDAALPRLAQLGRQHPPDGGHGEDHLVRRDDRLEAGDGELGGADGVHSVEGVARHA